uniref:TMEM131_like domain-containing protein n=1 Tax=Macrostomum lignano TaxID=282301 RepID=A0A1I8IKY7_9PLAT
VGKASTADLILENPTDKTVLAHLVPLSAYPGQASALSHLGLEAALQDATLDSSASDSAASSARSIRLTPTPRWATEYRRLPVGYPDIHPDTLAVLIRPRQRAHLPVTFRPTESGEFRALFLLRNNLTGVEPLLAVGRGARVELRASADSMEFGLAGATGLEPPCQRVPPSIWRQLTIVNPGPLTVDSGPPIVGRDASGCSDAGFMVAPCAPIRLGPNESLHMAVTFTPDLCQLRTTRELRLVGGALRVVLRGGLTPTQVAACSARLPRPPWETPLQTGLVGAVLAAALWAIMSACVTADRLSSASAAAAASSSSASANSASATSAAPPTALPQTEQSASKSTPSVVAVPDRSADSGLFSRLTAWLPCWWRRQRRAGRAGGAADGSLSVGGSSARGQASVGRHAAAASARSSVGLQQAAASTTASTGQPTVRRSRKLATAAAASQSTPSPSSTSADVGSPPLTAAAIRTPQFEPIAFPQIDRRGKPLPTKSKPSASKSQQQKAAPDLSGQQPSLAANGGRKASAGAAGQDQLRRQQQRQVQQHQEDCSTSSSNGSASDASSWETAGSAFQRVGAGNQRSVKAASSGFGSLAQQAQQQQQSAAVPTVSVRAVPLQPLQCKQQPKTSVVKPMMTHPRLRRGKALRTCIDESARQQQQQQRQQQQQLHQVAGPPTGLVAPWCQERPLSELAQVTLQKSQRMFHYEELRRQQLLQPATTQQQQQEARQESGWRGSEAVAWPEPTLSNRSLWGGFLDSGSSGGPNDPDDDENAGAVVGSSSDPVARMLLGETLLWDSPAPASSGWACFPDRQD